MANERFSSVWDAIADTPEEADNLRLRAELMGKIADRVAEWEVTQGSRTPGDYPAAL